MHPRTCARPFSKARANQILSLPRPPQVFGSVEMYASCVEEHAGHTTAAVTMADTEVGHGTDPGSEGVAVPQAAVSGTRVLGLLEKHEVVPLLVSKQRAVRDLPPNCKKSPICFTQPSF